MGGNHPKVMALVVLAALILSAIVVPSSCEAFTLVRPQLDPDEILNIDEQIVDAQANDLAGVVVSVDVVQYQEENPGPDPTNPMDTLLMRVGVAANTRVGINYDLARLNWIDDPMVDDAKWAWMDVTTPTDITDDDDGEYVPLPWDYAFYGYGDYVSYSKVWVCSNGWLSFDPFSHLHADRFSTYHPDFPSTSGLDLVAAPYWKDLDPSQGGSITYGSIDSDRFAISWNDVPDKNGFAQSFQVVFDRGVGWLPSPIAFRYEDVTHTFPSAKTGIENQVGDKGVSFYADSIEDGDVLVFSSSNPISGLTQIDISMLKNIGDGTSKIRCEEEAIYGTGFSFTNPALPDPLYANAVIGMTALCAGVVFPVAAGSLALAATTALNYLDILNNCPYAGQDDADFGDSEANLQLYCTNHDGEGSYGIDSSAVFNVFLCMDDPNTDFHSLTITATASYGALSDGGYLSENTPLGADGWGSVSASCEVHVPLDTNIEVTSPTAGSGFVKDTTRRISWTTEGIVASTMDMHLYKGETSICPIALGAPNIGYYDWDVPTWLDDGDDYRIRICATEYPENIIDDSPYFSILSSESVSVKVTSPNGGEVWGLGQMCPITWSSEGIATGGINIYLDEGGVPKSEIALGTSNDGVYNWRMPALPSYIGNDFSIRIQAAHYPSSVSDTSDGYFAIDNAWIDVTSPSESQSWAAGSTHDITWTSGNNPGALVMIELECGEVVELITGPTDNDGLHSWTIPQTQGPCLDCRVRVRSTTTSANDYSDEFSICSIEVVVPNGGEIVNLGTHETVHWHSSYLSQGDSVNIDLFKGGTFETNIVTGTENDGSYSWDVLETTEPGPDYTIRITSSPSGAADTSDGWFVLSDGPAFDLLSPNGGQSWSSTETRMIVWDSRGLVLLFSNVNIYLYKDGEEYLQIASNVHNSGYYEWTIPALPSSNDYRIRVQCAHPEYSYVDDYSDQCFTITPPGDYIVVKNPDGGETWWPGNTLPIEWMCDIPAGGVNIYLRKEGQPDISVAQAIDFYSYSWTIPEDVPAGSDYRIRIEAAADSNIFDESDKFSLGDASIDLTYPDGGEFLPIGSLETLTWSTTDDSEAEVRIDLYRESGFILAITESTENDMSYSWEVPDTLVPASDYLVMISRTSSVATDVSSSGFTISGGPSFELLSPSEGETLHVGVPYSIGWSSDGSIGDLVKIELLKGGTLHSTIGETSDDGLYPWFVFPDTTPGTDYQIRITSIQFPDLSVDSDEFAITTPPSIEVLSPNGGESWQAGIDHDITWTSQGDPIQYVRIDLYKGDDFDSTVSSATPNDGSYSWTIPSELLEDSDYSLRIGSTAYGYVYDCSDAFFTILPSAASPWILVETPNGGETLARGSSCSIYWSSQGAGSAVYVEIWKGGSYYCDMDVHNPGSMHLNDGEVKWYIGSDHYELGNDYQIRISSSGDYCEDFSDGYFSILDVPYLCVYMPDIDDSWEADTQRTIWWVYGNNPGNEVNIDLYKDGSFDSNIVTAEPNDGFYLWTIPAEQVPGEDYSIRIWTPITEDFSHGHFTIVEPQPRIEVVSPDHGEKWAQGTAHSIEWTLGYDPGPKVNIDLYKAGFFDSTIAVFETNDGLYDWNIPAGQTIGDDYRIRIWSTSTPAEDISDDDFSIVEPPWIAVTSPNGGETWDVDTVQTIQWTSGSNPGSYVCIELYKSGSFYSTIDASELNDGIYDWSIPTELVQGTDYTIRVSSTSTLAEDVSDDYFTIIRTPWIAVMSPNGGESWGLDSTHAITWYSGNDPGSCVNIDLHKSGFYEASIAFWTANDGSFVWTPTELIVGDDYTIRIWSPTTCAEDISDASFSIAAANEAALPYIDTFDDGITEYWSTIDTGGFVGLDSSVDAIDPPSLKITKEWEAGDSMAGISFQPQSYRFVVETVMMIGTLDIGFSYMIIGGGGQIVVMFSMNYLVWSTSSTGYDGIMAEAMKAYPVMLDIDVAMGAYDIWVDEGLGYDYKGHYPLRGTPGSAIDGIWFMAIGYTGYDYSVPVEFWVDDLKIYWPLLLNSPNGGESWTAGTTQMITWDSADDPGSDVRIDLYTSSGFHSTIVDATPNAGAYDWNIPASLTPRTDYLINITSLSSGAYDTSDGYFSIELWIDPSGGDTLAYSNSFDDGIDDFVIVDTGGFVGLDSSADAIDPPSLKITKEWEAGDSVAGISFQPQSYRFVVETVMMIGTLDIGASGMIIGNEGQIWVTFNANGLAWSTGGPIGYDGIMAEAMKAYPVMLDIDVAMGAYDIWVDEGLGYDYKGHYPLRGTPGSAIDGIWFTATGYTGYDYSVPVEFWVDDLKIYRLLLNSPNGGESWTAGTTQMITWDSADDPGSDVRIDLYTSSGFHSTIVDATPNAGAYDWNIPASLTPRTDYLINITSLSSGAYDTSDEFFSIPPPWMIILTFPNGGEVLEIGQTYDITWTSINSRGVVDIDLYKGGLPCLDITAVPEPDDGFYGWTVPTGLTVGYDYTIVISGSAEPSISDESDGYFFLLEDTVAPTTTSSLSGTLGGSGWYTTDVGVTLIATDTGSGVSATYYEIDGSIWTEYTATFLVTEGIHTVYYYSIDLAGSIEPTQSVVIKVDTTASSTSSSLSGTQGSDGWYTTAVEVTLTATDSTSGVFATYYKIDGSAWTEYTATLQLADGTHTVYYYSIDIAGNVEDTQSVVVDVDANAPATGYSFSGSLGDNGWYTTDVDVTLTATDTTSGVSATYYKIDGGAWTQYTTAFQITEGTHTVYYYSTDIAGNVEGTQSVVVKVDTVGPFTTSSLSGTLGANGWYISPVTVTLTVTDTTSGIQYSYYKVDSSTWTTYSTPFLISADGLHEVYFYSVDYAGNIEATENIQIGIDVDAPLTTALVDVDVVTLTASDPVSGAAITYYRIDGGAWTAYSSPFGVGTGEEHTVDYYSIDNAGNIETVRTTIVVDTPPTIVITSPTSDPTYTTNTTPVDLGGTSSDEIGVTSVEWYNSATGESGTASGTTIWAAAISLNEGANLITVTAYDTIGQPGTDSITVIYEVYIEPTITVVSPDSEDTLYLGKVFAIRWTWEGDLGDYVRIGLYKGTSSEELWWLVASNNGCYYWIVNSDLKKDDDYRVKISSVLYPEVYDYSDYFTIDKLTGGGGPPKAGSLGSVVMPEPVESLELPQLPALAVDVECRSADSRVATSNDSE